MILDHARVGSRCDEDAASQGTTASRLSAAHPFLLEPQLGLVPIGMNPVTKLGVFYHLKSAWDGKSALAEIETPKYQEDGTMPVSSGTGIVFVLLPGGTLTMGSQQSDPTFVSYNSGGTPPSARLLQTHLACPTCAATSLR